MHFYMACFKSCRLRMFIAFTLYRRNSSIRYCISFSSSFRSLRLISVVLFLSFVEVRQLVASTTTLYLFLGRPVAHVSNAFVLLPLRFGLYSCLLHRLHTYYYLNPIPTHSLQSYPHLPLFRPIIHIH